MKAWFSLWLALLVSFVVGSCVSLNGPQLGRYTYTQKVSTDIVLVRTIPIWIDKDFGEADKLAIDNAISAWNYAMNGTIRLRVVDTQFDMEIPKIVQQANQGGWLFMKINHNNPMIPDTNKGYWTIGFTERIGGHYLYLVRDRIQNEDVFGVTLHEIGHLMGSPHVGERLMYPHFGRARFQCVDYDTIVAVASYQHLDVGSLNYCVDKDSGQVTDKKNDPIEKMKKKQEMDQSPLL